VCAPTTTAVRLVDVAGSRPSVGLLRGQLWVSWAISTGDPDVDIVEGAWFDEDLEAFDAATLGQYGGGPATGWVSDGTRLWGALGLVPDLGSPPCLDLEKNLTLVAVNPMGPIELFPTPLPVSGQRECGNPNADSFGVNGRVQGGGRMSASLADGIPVFVGGGAPADCEDYWASYRGILFGPAGSVPLEWEPDNHCWDPAGGRDENYFGLPVVVTTSLGLAVLVRLSPSNAVSLLAVQDGIVLGSPTVVGRDTITYENDGGYQPAAVSLADDTILFTERFNGGVPWSRGTGDNHRHLLRRMHADGTELRDTPWQMGAMRDGRLVTSSTSLLRVGDGAALLWNERPCYYHAPSGTCLRYGTRITTDVAERLDGEPWNEGVYLAMLSADGLRTSEIVRVTDERATALFSPPTDETRTSPFGTDLVFAAASEGNRVVVVWQDRRPEAPGIYGRAFTCTPVPVP